MIKQHIGDSTTGELQLERAGRALFGKKLFHGAFAEGETFPKRGYCILNTASRSSGGEHWLAIANGLMYDSFGRDQSGDPEQRIEQKDCGQRCLAWLCVYDSLGREAAASI